MLLGSFWKDFQWKKWKKWTVECVYIDDILGMCTYLIKAHNIVSVFVFIKKLFIMLLRFGGSWATKILSTNNEPSTGMQTHINTNYNEPLFYLPTAGASNWGGTFNTIGDSYIRMCASDKVKNMNEEVF